MNSNSHRHQRSEQLDALREARHDLAKATTISEVTSVRARAQSVRLQAQQASLGVEIQNYATELKLQAERRAGQFLAELRLRGGDRKSQRGRRGIRLRDLGIDKNQSARWQLAASVPEPIFRDFVCNLHAAGREISSAALLRLAKVLREQPIDDLLVAASSALPIIATHSHLFDLDSHPTRCVGDNLGEINEIVNEIRNHHRLLRNVVESVCGRAALEPTSTDYRAIQRYFREIISSLDEVSRSLQRFGGDWNSLFEQTVHA